jgi:hypothetical protein
MTSHTLLGVNISPDLKDNNKIKRAFKNPHANLKLEGLKSSSTKKQYLLQQNTKFSWPYHQYANMGM